MALGTVSSRGQLVIPRKLRDKYGIKPGTKVEWIETGQGLMLIPIGDDPVRDSRGMLKGTKVSTKSLLEEREKDKKLEEKWL